MAVVPASPFRLPTLGFGGLRRCLGVAAVRDFTFVLLNACFVPLLILGSRIDSTNSDRGQANAKITTDSCRRFCRRRFCIDPLAVLLSCSFVVMADPSCAVESSPRTVLLLNESGSGSELDSQISYCRRVAKPYFVNQRRGSNIAGASFWRSVLWDSRRRLFSDLSMKTVAAEMRRMRSTCCRPSWRTSIVSPPQTN